MIIQMHLGRLHSVRVDCIKSIKSIYPDLDYFWIDDNNIESIMKDMNSYLGIDRIWPFETLRQRMELSDWVRWWYLATNPDAMWFDTDLTIKKWFVPDPATYGTKPYMNVGDNDDAMEYSWIICNGCPQWFEKAIRRRTAESRFGIMCDEVDGSVAYKIHLEYFSHWGSGNNLGKQEEKHWHQTP